MISSLFTSFDISVLSWSLPLHSIWLGILPSIIFTQSIWSIYGSRFTVVFNLTNVSLSLGLSTNSNNLNNMTLILVSIFYIFIISNITGGLPLTSTLTSHLSFTLSVGMPIWATIVIFSITNWNLINSHHVPEHTPSLIAPFISLIEALSSAIRPLTLSFRISANISAGHVILSIISSAGVLSLLLLSPYLTLSVILMGGGYIAFELAIYLVQAFVFILLAYIYSNDYFNVNSS